MPGLLQHVSCGNAILLHLFDLVFVFLLFLVKIYSSFAEQLCSATLKLLLCVETARRCCASPQVGVLGLQKGALSGERGINDGAIYFPSLGELK